MLWWGERNGLPAISALFPSNRLCCISSIFPCLSKRSRHDGRNPFCQHGLSQPGGHKNIVHARHGYLYGPFNRRLPCNLEKSTFSPDKPSLNARLGKHADIHAVKFIIVKAIQHPHGFLQRACAINLDSAYHRPSSAFSGTMQSRRPSIHKAGRR